MIKHESKFSLRFKSWWRSTRMKGAFELKDSKGKESIPFSCVEEPQLDFALASEMPKGNLVRVAAGTVGTSDYIALVSYPSYVVINFPNCFVIIRVAHFLKEKYKGKKSLTEERAKEIATVVV